MREDDNLIALYTTFFQEVIDFTLCCIISFDDVNYYEHVSFSDTTQ